jgi:tetratricopeptide (TPR) repeat protein
VADEIRRLSGELIDDPSSLAFLALAEQLRLAGDLAGAWQLAVKGRERHPLLAAAHDCAALIAAERGDVAVAAAAWETAVHLDEWHVGARKGLAFLAFRDGRLREALGHLDTAAAAAPDDESVGGAIAQVRAAQAAVPVARPTVATPPSVPVLGQTARSSIGVALFEDLAPDGVTIILLDAQGTVLAGSAPISGVERGPEIGRALEGIGDEATRAMRHLDLGAWTALTVEGTDAAAVLAPGAAETLLVVTAPRETPIGALRRVLAPAVARVVAWQGGEGSA